MRPTVSRTYLAYLPPLALLGFAASITSSWAACNNYAPATGQSVTCDTSSPNPATTGVHAAGGSSNVTVNVNPGSILNITRSPSENSGVSVIDSSNVTNNGAISLRGAGSSGLNRGAGLVGTGSNNTITNNGTIDTTNQFNDGMAADGAGNTLVNNGAITTTGPSSYGMTASWGQSGGGQPNNTLINNGSVTTNGSNARAVSILGANGTVVNAGALTTTGNSSPTVYLQGNGARLTNSGTIRAQGGAASGGRPSDGVFSNTLGSSFTATIENLAGGQIISDQGPAIRTLNGATKITNAGLLQGGNGLALSGGNGDIDFTLQTGSRIIGAADGGGGNNTLTLQGTGLIDNSFTNFQTLNMAGTDWTWAGTGDFHDSFIQSGSFGLQKDLTGNVTINAGAALLAGGGFNPTITSYPGGPAIMVANSGTIDLTNGGNGTGDRLTIAGNYTGNGGTIILNTYLGDDSSATDRVVVGNNTSGMSSLRVVNAGGPGAVTSSDGIRLIQVNGLSNGQFSLIGDYVIQGQQAVIGGAYAYTLWKNGVSNPADGNWYLRSQLPPVTPPVIPPVTPPVTPPVSPPVIPPAIPIYQPGVPLYEAYPQVLQSLNGLPTLQRRVGNRYWSAAGNMMLEQGDGPGTGEPIPSASSATFIEGRGIWARIEGVHSRFEPKVSTSSTDYDVDVFKLQAGLDGQLYESDAGKLIGGITVHYGHAASDISSFYGRGDIDTDGYGFGGTLTWYGANGFYADGQAQVTWYDSDLNSRTLSRSLASGNNGFGYALSAEVGQRLEIGGRWTVTPQAQLVYSSVDFDSFKDPFGAKISLDQGESLNGRLGLSLEHENSWYGPDSLIRRSHIYGIANLYYEFLDGSRVDVSGTKFANRDNQLWGGIGIGGSYNWAGDKYSVYGEGSLNTSLEDFADSYALKGTVGFKIKW